MSFDVRRDCGRPESTKPEAIYSAESGSVPLDLDLPLDEEAGSKLGIVFRLQLRVKELDRIELMARRIARFTTEEASYWLSRTNHFGPDANRWAISGLRILLGGQPKDPAVGRMLDRLCA